jgi:Fe2+ or Zn2+ uptake regulation protein
VPKIHAQERREELAAVCRARGLPLTAQRRAVFDALVEADDHPTADAVFARVRGRVPRISRTTVYRVLEAFAAAGLVQRVPHFLGGARYDGNPRRHDHVVCRVCGAVADVHDAGIRPILLPAVRGHGHRLEGWSVVFVGTCAACRSGVGNDGR